MKRLLALFLLCSAAYAVDFKQTDIFTSVGTNLLSTPRESYSIGIGHKFKKLRRTELATIYTYGRASQSQALALTRTIHLPGRYTSVASLQGGITSPNVSNPPLHTYMSGTYGVGMHIHYRYTLSVNETVTRTDYRPVYLKTGIGLTHGWWSISANTSRTSDGDRTSQICFGVSLSALASGEHKEHPRVFHTSN